MFDLLTKVTELIFDRLGLSVSSVIKTLMVCMIMFGGIGSIGFIRDILPGDWSKYLAIGAGVFCSIIIVMFSGLRLIAQKMLAGIKTPLDASIKSSSLILKVYLTGYSRKLLIARISKKLEEAEKSKKKPTKTETVTELFLISQQNKLAKAKRYSMYGLLLSFASSVALSTPFEFNLIFFGLLLLIQIKEELLIYRVNKGYFGSTTREAMMLIEFIGEQKDDSDMNSGGRRKQVFKPLVEQTEKAPSLGSLENFR